MELRKSNKLVYCLPKEILFFLSSSALFWSLGTYCVHTIILISILSKFHLFPTVSLFLYFCSLIFTEFFPYGIFSSSRRVIWVLSVTVHTYSIQRFIFVYLEKCWLQVTQNSLQCRWNTSSLTTHPLLHCFLSNIYSVYFSLSTVLTL